MAPTLNLQNLKHEDVENEVEKFLSLWLRKHLFTYFVVGDSETLSALVLKVVKTYGLEYQTDLPGYPGRIRVVMYDEFH